MNLLKFFCALVTVALAFFTAGALVYGDESVRSIVQNGGMTELVFGPQQPIWLHFVFSGGFAIMVLMALRLKLAKA